ncbi:CRISPR-associated endonuclease/helicase Cas3 [Myxococcaceae bacterium]|nr:CRISPR-associated endonuclease/helicase Cas3 [Myxococcaceae bacterium]
MRAIADLVQAARQAFPDAFSKPGNPIPNTPALQHRFAGLVMLADWLGSHQSFFPLGRPVDGWLDLDAANHALLSVGLNARNSQAELAYRPAAFAERFGFVPRPLQTAIDSLPSGEPQARLLIAEAETGSGKTEAALTRFFKLFAACEVDSLYFALPTRVAARELYRRVLKYLQRVFPDQQTRPLALLAVPRYAQVDGVEVEKLLPDDKVRWHDDPNQHRQERQWAAEHPKRFLAATVAVGTIDQALLSAVQTKHAHLRSVCLDRSLLVVDEVHASDAYMRRLLCGLLAHHVGQMQGHALLLSATLGAAARTEFLQACGCASAAINGYPAACAAPYPAYTDLGGIPYPVERTGDNPSKRVLFESRPWLKQPEKLLPKLAEALRASARVLAVFNTVARAVALQRAVEQHPGIANAWLFRCGTTVCPHHGRFTPSDRELLDKAVSDRFGKDTPAGPILLIGTQTLEQSLDIDTDWLITDLCPADVLLQRVGRLHRHGRERPAGFETARCTVLTPDCGSLEDLLDAKGEALGEAKKSGLGSVYEDLRTLELTRLMLAGQPEVEIPLDNRRLVEGATHPERLTSLAGERWAKHGEKVDGVTLAKELAAFYAAASYGKPFGECGFNDIEKNAQARTRLGLDTLRIPLAAPERGPFGIDITEVMIPGHLAPKNTTEETAEVLSRDDGVLVLCYGGQHYRYSRYGLEKLDEPAD